LIPEIEFCHFNITFVTVVAGEPVTSNRFLVIPQNCYRKWKNANKHHIFLGILAFNFNVTTKDLHKLLPVSMPFLY
jgi:hypothetical protein